MKLILRDFFSFAPSASRQGSSSSDPTVRELAKNSKGIKVVWEASHAGMVNGNHVMYSPAGMTKCVSSWVWPQRRPVQIHHDDHADPIGRVINAYYLPYNASDVADKIKDAKSLLFNKPLTRDSVVEIAKQLEDSEVLNQPDWKGVGKLMVEGIITDSEAAEKILDGRYQGVSITQYPQQAFCSICGQDWVAEGPCEHERGQRDEETKREMYFVIGDTQYDEISYVNRPADNHAQNISITQVGFDSESTEKFGLKEDRNDLNIILDRSMKIDNSFQLLDSLNEDINMNVKTDIPVTTETEEIASEEEAISDNIEQEPESDISEVIESDTETETTDPIEETESREETINTALKCLFEEEENLTAEMTDLLGEALEELVEEDAQLNTKKRKSLPNSVFCGPSRSFPVNDCAHYTAAKKLIGRYKGPGDKSKILSCIEKKGKTLGCTSSDSDLDQSIETDNVMMTSAVGITMDQMTPATLSDEQLVNILLNTEKEMVQRGLKAERKCDHCEELETELSDIKTEVPDLRDTVKVLREEWKTVVGEHEVSELSHQETLSELRDVLKDYVKTIMSLTDKKSVSDEDLNTQIEALTVEDMKKYVKENDISEIISFIRSGITQEPTETIQPTDTQVEEVITTDPVLNLAESLVKITKDHGSRFGIQCLSDWIKAGKLPEDFTLDKAFEIVAK